MRFLASLWESIFAFAAVKFLWKLKGIRHQAIQSFQATEADGVWHLFRGLDKETDPKLKASLFSHLIEEQSHADLFAKTYKEETGRAFQYKNVERFDIYPHLEPSWKNLVYVHVGEIEAVSRFGKIINNLTPSPLRTSLESILKDEEGHVDLTMDGVLELGIEERQFKAELNKIQRKRFKEAWMRTGGRGVDNFSNLLLSTLYFFLVGPFLFLFARKKIDSKTVVYDNNTIKEVKL